MSEIDRADAPRWVTGEGAYGVAPPAHRLPADSRIGRVRLQIADLERSLHYYGEVLGLRVLERSAEHAALGTPNGGAPLVELVQRRGAAPARHRGQLGLFHFAILLPDRQSLGRLLVHLSDHGERVGASDHLVSEALYLQDPDGLGIEVYSDRPRASWRTVGGELIIDTRPLDLQDLARAGGGEGWRGIPAGTVIGHVHLHVGDLSRASAFYHDGLGLDKVVWSYPGALFLSAGGYHHHLGLNTWSGPGAVTPGEDDARLIHWELVVPTRADVEAALASLEGMGHAVERGAGGGLVSDPWRTALRLSAEAPGR